MDFSKKAGPTDTNTNTSSSRAVFFQPKLTINHPNDVHEQEADKMADKVMRMTDDSVNQDTFFKPANGALQRKCQACEEEDKHVHRKESNGGDLQSGNDLDNYVGSLSSKGQPLPESSRKFFEPKFGHDFSNVRLHTDGVAAKSAESINSLAYTSGNNIVFNTGQYSPESDGGKRLMAHELTHVVQQTSNKNTSAIQKYPSCTSAQDKSIAADHALALKMLNTAISKISSYNGTTPTEVNKALAANFDGATSNAFATWININLRILLKLASDSYECFTGGAAESKWACTSPSDHATTFWCVPGVNIRICPLFFSLAPIDRGRVLIHEWVHKYGCNFDLGYKHEDKYKTNSTVTQLLNADSFAHLVKDVQ